ncbi:LysR family transcriptional regulator [Variovorax sp. WS11]|uniref:LysR family transcriptional regulator n=1 Tax=Variovorax sp. WS11 TaxID=1105204 RepID=UPI000D0DFBB5|nr:LysR family transcriptional regulator [Variovorax sp. WS11]NDZ13338.1 LysR family transcriptional regulator [Variovorax sp. WS11]PSL79662.1 LysR family transcriptional regulator [Variovorax sp. WS11]
MNLTLRQLRAFDAVAETGSFTAAAARLHLTQSALSVLVRELEREMGVQLFDRHTRRVLLSEAGRAFQPSVQRLLADLAGAVAGVTELRDQKRGLLRLAAPQLMACTLMPRVIAVYRACYPDIEVRLADTLPEHLLTGLASGEAELAVGQDVEVDPAAVERRTLFRDRHWLICPSDHAFARRRKVRWSELGPYTFIAPTRDFRQRVLPELEADARAFLLRASTQEVSYMTTALGMVASGLGLTVCPTYSASLVRAHGLQMVKLDRPDFHREVCVYVAARRSLSPAAAGFVQILERFAQPGLAG